MSHPKVSILIPTLESRVNFFKRIVAQLEWQRLQLPNPDDVEIIYNIDKGEKSTGVKRNELVGNASGDYVAFVDDDDQISDVYLKKMVDAANSGLDAGSLVGLYFLNGVYDRPFLHSIKYTHWYQDDKFFYRDTNHLNIIKRSIALQVPYPDQFVGEDGKFSESLRASGLVKTEYEIKETVYFYFDRSKITGQ